MVQQIEGKSIGKKSLLVLLKLLLPTGEKPNPPAGFPTREGGVIRLPSPRRRPFGGEVLGLALFIGILLLSESVAATATATSVSIAQQPATSSPDATTTNEQQAYERGLQLLQQGQQLQNQGTAESRQQALAKYEEALSIWQQLAELGFSRISAKPIPQGDLAFLQKHWTFITKRDRFTKRRDIALGKRPFSTTSALATTNWGKWRKPSMP
jgi:hypothetical protein